MNALTSILLMIEALDPPLNMGCGPSRPQGKRVGTRPLRTLDELGYTVEELGLSNNSSNLRDIPHRIPRYEIWYNGQDGVSNEPIAILEASMAHGVL